MRPQDHHIQKAGNVQLISKLSASPLAGDIMVLKDFQHLMLDPTARN